MTLTVRPITDAEVPAFREAMMTTFGEDAADADPDGDARTRATLSQGWAAFDGAQVVGTAGTFDHAIATPGGGTLRMAGLTMVTVRPTHRRRGILRALIDAHLADARARAYPVSGLWASEAAIYGRFGYGLASLHHHLEIPSAHTLRMTRESSDTLLAVDEATARTRLPAIYARAMAHRPGALQRSAAWWTQRRFMETAYVRRGASRRRHVIVQRGGEDVGYVQYRQRNAFTDGQPNGRAEIVELVAVDLAAETALWRFMLSLDLFPTVTWWCAPVDCALPWLVDDYRRVRASRLDNLWLRVEDVAATLAARHYRADGELRFSVDGTAYQLVVRDGHGECTPASSADLVVTTQTLGSLLLGGFPASQLASAGRIHGEPRAIGQADSLFGSAIAPWCPEVF